MTSFIKASRRLLLLVPLALGLAACGSSSGASAAGGQAAVAASGSGVTVDVLPSQSWSGGFNGIVRLQNVSFASPITSFQVVFKLSSGSAAVPGWNGTISGPDSSGNYTARNPDWLQYSPINAGGSWEVGFGGSGSFSSSTIVSLTVNGQSITLGGNPTSDFTIAAPASASVTQGATTTATVTITRTNFTGAVACTASGLPSGVSASWNPTSTTGTSTVATLSATSSATVGTSNVTVSCTSGSVTKTGTIALTVNPAQTSDFAIAAPSAASVTVGQSTNATVTITRTNFTGAVACTASGLPSGVSASWNPTSTTGTSTVATLSATSSATTGTSNVTVSCTSGSVTKTATIALTVNPAQTSDFAIAAPTSAAVTQGATTTATVTITRTNFTGAVACTASGLPSGVSASWNPTSTTGTSTVATLSATSSATVGTSNVTVSCTSGSVTKTATIALTVSPVTTSTFALAASPATLSVARSASGTSTIAITRTNFTGTIALTASGLPTGVTASFNPASATGTSSIVTLAASSTATVGGPVTVTITGTSGSTVKTTTIALTVTNGSTCTGNCGKFRVVNGRITKDGAAFPVHCGSWFGLQGRYEPASDSANPRGAPMEQYVGNTFWASNHSRTVMQTMNEIKQAGITVIRLPVVHQTLSGTDTQGNGTYYKNYSGIINDATYPMKNSRQAMESMIKAANAVGIAVMLDIHSCSNYIDWRKGRLDARPPWVDATRDNYDYKREEWSCADTLNPSTVTKTQPYNETIWLQDLKTLAGLSQSLGVTNIIGIDIFNEPWDYSWTEWKTLTEHAYQAINSVNPNLLLFVQGISGSNGNQDGTPNTKNVTPHGDTATNPNWGENLYPAGADLPNVPVEQLVWSPHTYGPSVAVQPMFMDPAQPQCAGLEGDAAGDAKCQMVINSTLLRSGWEEHFGYLKDLGYAIVVGEFGGNMDWPLGQASLRDQARFSYLTDKSIDAKWQNAFVDYMIDRKIEGCYWSINPESGDTGGWYGHEYDPVSNTGGWGAWKAFDSRKTTLLNRHWAGVP